MALQYAYPVDSPRPGESAIWRCAKYEEAMAPEAPRAPERGSFLTSFDLEASDCSAQNAFPEGACPPISGWWHSAYGVFRVGKSRAGGGARCMGARPLPTDKEFFYWTFDEADEKARLLGSGLTELLREGVVSVETFADETRNGGKFANVGILLHSRREWILTDLAISAYPPLTSVTLHYTFPPDHMKAILLEAGVSTLVTDVEQLKVVNELKADLPLLRGLVVVNLAEETARLAAEKPEEKEKLLKLVEELRAKDVQVFDFQDILEKGRRAYIPPIMEQDPERIFTIVYTSGTTGNPKGVMMSNRNFVREIQGCLHINDYTLMLDDDFLHFALLPLSHVFERMVEYVAYGFGAAVAYFSRKKELLADDWRFARPSCLIMVPRVAALVLDSIETQMQQLPFLKRAALNFAIGRKLHARRAFVAAAGRPEPELPARQQSMASANSSMSAQSASSACGACSVRGAPPLQAFWYDKVLGASATLQTRLFGCAGRIRFLLSGGGKLNPDVQEKLEAYLATSFLQGWGMTETSGAGCWQARAGDGSLDNAGGPSAVMEMKLRSWEEYDAERMERPQGELLVRGENVFEGYFRQKAMTDDAFVFDEQEEGRDQGEEAIWRSRWLATGDIVEIQPNGSIKIIDRKKSLIKLAQGEYLQTEKLESIYGRSAFVDNIFVHGYDSQSYPVAVVVPNRQTVALWAEKRGATPKAAELTDEQFAELLREAELKKDVLLDLNRLAVDANLLGFEKVKNVHLTTDVWTPDNGMLTPTFKTKRAVMAKTYKADMDRLYDELSHSV
ncbi:AMP-binding enzyme domain-containing protein [Toxoplasma gondii ME49]|uniref:AMP-binding enzyme domain-containing protein n=12 Tax=Toxoplasma gondii TaxID=5811 RepID=A0A125YRV1_TOXGV|nr:AMP-binding enzyme domain-containing protein [Toxoplasma gondii ME49]EPR60871.1 AMP-binding enzyme domain-containing protein [Toxoplasma gondii GT1]ESS34833.1 AMP-binding enzyme domain-containing protein [Toxoplasma gondii VEG]KAF4639187.1 AMP-binding enzyme domain-containing protein [Toxoplasma gondii]KFG40772.1 AMP-binding enzyme domain-containing protein [Toxoplasma gondii p89]KFG55766.1 AMP-binding enzyme domain-containing protein [Toxoplasma gondii FOU]KFH02431.1 AMP-binding enzyme do|eukprot:XP_018635588.1 AMP-binding enzyme domain-containing protein [Toxoplasma gondii ME49]